jgi:hypothetical protein
MVREYPFVWPLLEFPREFAATNLKAESSLELEHNARWTGFGVAQATCGTTANVLTLLLPAAFLRVTSSILIDKVRTAKRWKNGERVLIAQIAKDSRFPQPPPLDYSDSKEHRNHNDLAGRIQKRFEELECGKSKEATALVSSR